MKQRLITAGLCIVAAIGVYRVGFAFTAQALECAALPKSICDAADQKAGSSDVSNTAIWKLLLWTLNIMIALVGLAATGAIIYAGILYSSAGGNADMIAKAKKIIMNTVIGIVAFALMYLGLNWLIPGGIFT